MNIAGARRSHRRGLGRPLPNGCHINVVLAHRGSPTAAAAITCSRTLRRATRPCSCCVGPTAARVPADLAADADDEQGDRDTPTLETMTWGAAQLGIGQAVLDAVAAGLIEATGT